LRKSPPSRLALEPGAGRPKSAACRRRDRSSRRSPPKPWRSCGNRRPAEACLEPGRSPVRRACRRRDGDRPAARLRSPGDPCGSRRPAEVLPRNPGGRRKARLVAEGTAIVPPLASEALAIPWRNRRPAELAPEPGESPGLPKGRRSPASGRTAFPRTACPRRLSPGLPSNLSPGLPLKRGRSSSEGPAADASSLSGGLSVGLALSLEGRLVSALLQQVVPGLGWRLLLRRTWRRRVRARDLPGRQVLDRRKGFRRGRLGIDLALAVASGRTINARRCLGLGQRHRNDAGLGALAPACAAEESAPDRQVALGLGRGGAGLGAGGFVAGARAAAAGSPFSPSSPP
jgi:hypothetical protein